MSFFPKWALGTDAKPEPKRKKEYDAKPGKRATPHLHRCDTCDNEFKCYLPNCKQPERLSGCWSCGSHFTGYTLKK